MVEIENKWDETLRRARRFEPPSVDFSERIIRTARTIAQVPSTTFSEWLKELLAAVLPQHPAFALATVLTLGVVIGLSLPDPTLFNGDRDVAIQSSEEEGAIL